MDTVFNLVDEPFIPCILLDGSRKELGLRDTLARAHGIREIRDDSPLVTIALHRLLLAILHRNFGPASMDAWAEIWRQEKFDTNRLDDYLRQWRDRFFLIHPRYPFYQIAVMDDAKPVSVWRLALVQANNATLFDHRTEHEMPAVAPEETTRLLIGYQAFAVGGGVSKPFNFMHSPLTRDGGFVAIVLGSNLFETLWLNAGRYDSTSPFPSTVRDRPTWERDALDVPRRGGRMPEGYLDYLTWQPRRIRLLPDKPGTTRFSRMLMLQGECLPETFAAVEPMMAYQKDARDQFCVRGLQRGRSVWRDSHCLFTTAQDVRPPRAMIFLADCRARGILPGSDHFLLSAMGMCSDRAKVSFWRHETLPLPLAYLGDQSLDANLTEAVSATEDGASILWRATTALAERILETPGGKSADKKDVGRLRDGLSYDTRYWARMEQPFRHFIVDLPGDEEHQEACLNEWILTVRQTVHDVFHEIVESTGDSPRTLRAIYSDAGGRWGALKTLNIELARNLPVPSEQLEETIDE